jgi:hypothetical protein
LQQVQKAYADSSYWHIEVGWDWGMDAEIGGDINLLPLMKQWLNRT